MEASGQLHNQRRFGPREIAHSATRKSRLGRYQSQTESFANIKIFLPAMGEV